MEKNQFHLKCFPWASRARNTGRNGFQFVLSLFCWKICDSVQSEFYNFPHTKASVPEICWKSYQLMISLARTQWKIYRNWIIFPFSGKAFLKNCRKNIEQNKEHRFPENSFEWFFLQSSACTRPFMNILWRKREWNPLNNRHLRNNKQNPQLLLGFAHLNPSETNL